MQWRVVDSVCCGGCVSATAAMASYRRLVAVVAVAALAAAAVAAPAPDCDRQHYDQRQNGSENYRLNIDGVVIAVAPAESLLAAASDIDFGDLLDLSDLNEIQPKPKPPSDEHPLKPPAAIEPKPQDGQPDSKPEGSKPEAPLSDVTLPEPATGQKKEVGYRKQEKAQRLKMRLASMLRPLLRRNRHHQNHN